MASALMLRPKGNVAEETQIVVDADDEKLVRSEFNAARIAEIQRAWTTGTQTLVRDNRLYVREGTLSKLCRKGLKPRHFFLFNDILVRACGPVRAALGAGAWVP
jgi:hypothetical protein